MIRTLDRYLLRSFFTALLVVTLAIGLTIMVINMVEETRGFIDHKVPLLIILEYYLYFAGWVVKSFLPMFVLLATLFSVSMLARRNEILAMKANGLSLYRVTLPYLVITILIALGHFYYSEYIFPPLNQRRLEIRAFSIEERSKESLTHVQNVFRQIRPGYFYTLSTFDAARSQGTDLKLYETAGNQVRRVVTARRVEYVEFRWLAHEGSVREFTDSTHETYHKFDTMTIVDMIDKPEEFSKRIGKPDDMGLEELRQYIDLMKRTGDPFLRESIDLKLKYAFPLSSVIVVLISIPFASNPRRGGIAVSFAVGAVIALLYFILFRVMQSAGYNEKLPDYVAVWGVNGLFLFLGMVLMFRARK